MQVTVVKSKIHRVKVTGADLNYIGSISIDEDLMDAANIIRGEKVQIVNNNNGERLETYAIPGPRNSGEITLNGAAARRVAVGDVLILITYAFMELEEAKAFNDESALHIAAQLLERLEMSTAMVLEFDEDFVSPVRCQQNLARLPAWIDRLAKGLTERFALEEQLIARLHAAHSPQQIKSPA